MSAGPALSGLEVRKNPYTKRWYVLHVPSGKLAITGGSSNSLRLRRQALAAMADLYATGIDWASIEPQDFAGNQEVRAAYGPVFERWRERIRKGYDPETGECYGFFAEPSRYQQRDSYRDLVGGWG